jgi:hypothetical protein
MGEQPTLTRPFGKIVACNAGSGREDSFVVAAAQRLLVGGPAGASANDSDRTTIETNAGNHISIDGNKTKYFS